MAGLTLDSGALIAWERNPARIAAFLQRAVERHQPPTVPTVVIAETWPGGRSARIVELLTACKIEALDATLARQAALLRRETPDSGTVDAVVVASAARRGDCVLTQDYEDLSALAARRPEVRVLTV